MKKTTHLIILLLSSYYSFSQTGVNTTNLQAQLGLTDPNIRLSNYETGIDVYLISLESGKDIIENSFNNTCSLLFNSTPNGGSRIYTKNALMFENSFKKLIQPVYNNTLVKIDNRTRFWYYKNIENDFVEFIFGINTDPYYSFC